MIKRIRVSNFKSLTNEEVELGNFNVLIGANASGKSNFVDVIRFLHDIQVHGVSRATGSRLGWGNVLKRGQKKLDKIELVFHCDLGRTSPKIKREKKSYEVTTAKYIIEVSHSQKRFFIDKESLESQLKQNGREIKEGFERSRDKVNIISSIYEEKNKVFDVPKQLMDVPYLGASFSCFSSSVLESQIGRWRFYELDVNTIRRPCYDEGQDFLLTDGSNLSAILENLRNPQHKATHKRILNLMSILIPGFEDWKTERQFDGSLGFKIQEKGIKIGFPPKVISDGTIRLLSILIALLYKPTKTSLICIDEPERYLHPQVLKTLVEIMRDVSQFTQLIITTHSAELVKWLKADEVLLVDKIDGTTRILRGQNVEKVDKFLEEFSLDELWLSGYLKAGKVM